MQSKQIVGPLNGLFEYIKIPLCPQRGQTPVLNLIIGWIAPFEEYSVYYPYYHKYYKGRNGSLANFINSRVRLGKLF